MNDYQYDYKTMYEELREMVRLYFEVKFDDGTLYDDDDEFTEALEDIEVDLCLMVGLINEEDLDEDTSDYP